MPQCGLESFADDSKVSQSLPSTWHNFKIASLCLPFALAFIQLSTLSWFCKVLTPPTQHMYENYYRHYSNFATFRSLCLELSLVYS